MTELELLNFYNPWWLTSRVPEVLLEKYHRTEFTKLELELPYMDFKRIISLVGPRQTGKSTLLYQLIEKLIDKEIDPKRIIFLPMSDPAVMSLPSPLETFLGVYEENVLGETLDTLGAPIYLFLDEIQYLDDWELWLKRYYDQKYKIKMVISGSASSKIIQKGRESLAGRISEVQLFPMSFAEMLELVLTKENKLASSDPRASLWSYTIGFHRIFIDLGEYKSFNAFGRQLEKERHKVTGRQQTAITWLSKYIQKGGFPGVYKIDDISVVYRYLTQDVLDRVTAQDIPQVAEVKDVRLLQSLILTVAQRSGSIFSYRNLSLESGARSETIRKYLTYLNSAFLTWDLWQFRKAELARLKADKKFYICDTGLRHAILKSTQAKIFSNQERGIDAETLVFTHLKKRGFPLSFWRKSDREVDFVVDQYGFVYPIEVKYRRSIDQSDLRGIQVFIEKYKLSGGIIVTESEFGYRDGIAYVPLWLFLLIV